MNLPMRIEISYIWIGILGGSVRDVAEAEEQSGLGFGPGGTVVVVIGAGG